MRAMFCSNCKSMTFPGQSRCRVCGRPLDEESLSVQTCLTSDLDTVEEPKVITKENPDAPYLPYVPRLMQLDIIADIVRALDGHRHIVLESGTGTGKTIVSLAAGLDHAKRKNKKIIYLTRTISQSDQVMKELKAISSIKPVSGITVTGRNKSCLLFNDKEGFEDLAPNILSLMCEDKKNRSMHGSGGCRYFDKMKAEIGNIEDYCRREFPKFEQLDKYCEGIGVCPYEAKKLLMKNFDVIVAPYIHILSADIRTNFFANIGGEDTPVLLIVDEAHNLIDAAREQESFSISMRTIHASIDECMTLNKPEVISGVIIDDFIKYLRLAIKQLAQNKIQFAKKEARLDPGEFEDLIINHYKIKQSDLNTAIERMINLGEMRMDALSAKEEPGISEIYDLAINLKKWVMSNNDSYIRSVKTNDDGEYLSAACIDPSDISMFMKGLDGAIHMSGTLQPLDQYVKIMGLPMNTVPRTYPSPFPKENRPVIYVDDLTTNYNNMKSDPNIARRMEIMIARLCNRIHKNTLVFFPSYRLMREFRPYLENNVSKPLYWEESGKQKKTMRSLDMFRNGDDGVFFCVMGGSIAEGMDFPGDELCLAIIVGIPYPPPSMEADAMKEMFDKKYGPGMGWRFVSEVPAIRKIRQASGRLIRMETDRGMTIILDSRASKYARQLEATLSVDPVYDAGKFFDSTTE